MFELARDVARLSKWEVTRGLGDWPGLKMAALHRPLYKVSFHFGAQGGAELLTEGAQGSSPQAPFPPPILELTNFSHDTSIGIQNFCVRNNDFVENNEALQAVESCLKWDLIKSTMADAHHGWWWQNSKAWIPVSHSYPNLFNKAQILMNPKVMLSKKLAPLPNSLMLCSLKWEEKTTKIEMIFKWPSACNLMTGQRFIFEKG